MEKWIVDRIEEEYVVIENGKEIINLSKNEINFEIKEGDVLSKDEDGKFTLDYEETISRKEYIENITKDLWGD